MKVIPLLNSQNTLLQLLTFHLNNAAPLHTYYYCHYFHYFHYYSFCYLPVVLIVRDQCCEVRNKQYHSLFFLLLQKYQTCITSLIIINNKIKRMINNNTHWEWWNVNQKDQTPNKRGLPTGVIKILRLPFFIIKLIDS